MDSISNMDNGLNIRQDNYEMLKTKQEADYFNKTLQKDGKEPVKNMGKDEFLKLLITELQHQDPTNPMQDREFIAQMAQFSSLEQMLNFNKNMSKLLDNVSFQSSFNLLGLNVNVNTTNIDESGNFITSGGMVESVNKKGSEVFIKINGEEYPVSDIVSVGK